MLRIARVEAIPVLVCRVIRHLWCIMQRKVAQAEASGSERRNEKCSKARGSDVYNTHGRLHQPVGHLVRVMTGREVLRRQTGLRFKRRRHLPALVGGQRAARVKCTS